MYNLQPAKKSNGFVTFLAIIGGFALVLFAVALFVFILPLSSTASTPSTPSTRNEVVYKIRFNNGLSNPDMTPCGDFGLTYAVPSGTAQKETEACAGLTEVARFQGNSGDHLYLSIQNTWPNNEYAQFSCIIEVDGRDVAQVESIGAPNIASCSTLLN